MKMKGPAPEENRNREEENFRDTFLSVFFVGGFIVAVWVAVFCLYLYRLWV